MKRASEGATRKLLWALTVLPYGWYGMAHLVLSSSSRPSGETNLGFFLLFGLYLTPLASVAALLYQAFAIVTKRHASPGAIATLAAMAVLALLFFLVLIQA